jgi:hypothetical protein
MRHHLVFFLTTTLFAILLVGCNGEQESITGVSAAGVGILDVDPSLTVESATLYLTRVQTFDGTAIINAHAILKPWDETDTYNSFIVAPPTAYNPAVAGSSAAGGPNPWSINVTSIVQSWLNGTTSNYGILLEEDLHPYTQFWSNEGAGPDAEAPYLVVNYVTGSGNHVSLTIRRDDPNAEVRDTYVWALHPDSPGSIYYLFTGNVPDLTGGSGEKLSLLYFNYMPQGTGCTRTIGYWKTHAGFGPQADVVTPLLPIWLGTSLGSKSVHVTNAATAVQILSMRYSGGTPSNGISKLYAQLLGAKLNIASGAAPGSVAMIFTAADAFLATHNQADWNSLTRAQKDQVLGWQSELDAYNNGLRGVEHCD